MHSKNLGAYLAQADGINSLMPQAKRLLELRQVLLDVLPEPLADSATVANYRQGRIVVFAVNSAIAAKLKLLAPALMNRFTALGVQVTALEIEVQPSLGAAKKRPKGAILTEGARQALADLEAQLTDPKLKSTISAIAAQKVGKR